MTSETLRDICSAVDVPIVAIGGINRDNLLSLAGSGVDGAALVSAISRQRILRGIARSFGRWQRGW